jgi:hypothetical protein
MMGEIDKSDLSERVYDLVCRFFPLRIAYGVTEFAKLDDWNAES